MGGTLSARAYPREAHVERTNSHNILRSLILPPRPIWYDLIYWHEGWDVRLVNRSDTVLEAWVVLHILQLFDGISSNEGGLIITFANVVNARNSVWKCWLTVSPECWKTSCTRKLWQLWPLHEKKPTTPNRRTSVKHLNQPCKTLQCRVMNSSNVGNTWMRCIFSQNQTHNLHHEDDGEIFDFIH